jgi:TPR repeat protein
MDNNMTTDNQNILKVHAYIENYYILAVEYVGNDVITYRAENMKNNREVYLYEYFPKAIAKRYYNNDENFIVYVHPSQSELFDAQKVEFQTIYNKLKSLDHPSIPVIYELLESSGTLYVAAKYNKNTTSLSQQQMDTLVPNLVRVLFFLQQHEIAIKSLNLDNVLMDNLKQVPLFAYVEYKTFDKEDIQNSLEKLGKLLEEIINLESTKSNKVYSVFLSELVSRMTSDDVSKQFRTFQELQNLLQRYESTATEHKVTMAEKEEKQFPFYTALGAMALVFVFVYYILTQPSIEVKNITWFDSVRYHLLAYTDNIKGESALGLMYKKGYYVSKDINESIFWYKKAAQQGNLNAELNLVDIYKHADGAKDEKAAHIILIHLARAGNLYAQKTLGYDYMRGEDVPKNYKQAMYWFIKAAKQGDGYSCGVLGWMYGSGNGVEKDLSKALTWFKKGIDRNDAYSKKEFVNVKKTIKILADISLHNKSLQEYKLAYQYETGRTRNKNYKQAMEHYKKAATLGNVNAEFRLAQLCERIYRNYPCALKWYKKAAEDGDRLAYYRVSKMYRAGDGVKKDDKLALEWCRKAAERGLGVAQRIMGFCYEYGRGTYVSYSKARYWYELAIASGYKNAVGSLEHLNEKINPKEKIITISRKREIKKTNRKIVKQNYVNTPPLNIKACLPCHGQHFQKRAFGKSAIVANMSSEQIARALKGYKYGGYGGPMKLIMKGQVSRYSDYELETLADKIGH